MVAKAQPFVTGAVQMYAGVGPAHVPMFLGWGREAPRIQIRYAWAPFFSDLTGPLISLDDVYAGAEAIISVTLNFFRQDTFAKLESVPNALLGAAGINPFGDIGSLAIFEGLTFPLWLVYPYHILKPAYLQANPPKGVRFFAARQEGPAIYTQGTVPREIGLVLKAKSALQPNGALILADNNITGLPAAA